MEVASAIGFLSAQMEIIPHANLENLAEALSGKLLAGVSEPKRRPVVVPSVAFSEYLQLKIADRLGVCMGMEFLTPQSFIRRVSAPAEENSWEKGRLIWRILPLATEFSKKMGVIGESTSRDRFALAEALADRIDQYGHFRPEIIRQWAVGNTFLNSTATMDQRESELWQRELWNKLREDIVLPHPALDLDVIKRGARYLDRLKRDFPEVLILGTGSIDPLLVELLGVMTEAGCEVSIHVVLPSLEFLGDLKKKWKTECPSIESDAEDLEIGGGHPLLESMGRHAAGSFLLLGKLDDQYTNWPESAQGKNTRQRGMLNRLQEDIHARTPPVRRLIDAADISIRVHSCYGPRREMEVLHDEILRAFQDIPDLKPSEIHIVTPSMDVYTPLVSAVLEQGQTPLKVRLTEVPVSGRDELVEGLLTLLEVSKGGRFEASWILELLQLRAVQKALGIDGEERALERVQDWIRQSGLTQGLGDDHTSGSWTFARDRLIAGAWIGQDEEAKYPDGSFVLAVADQLGSEAELRARLAAWHTTLESTMKCWQQDCTPSQWGERLGEVCESLLGSGDESKVSILPHLAFLAGLDCKEMIDSGTVRDWLEGETQESGRRTTSSGRIAFGRFKQMQNIPCRVLAMVGMQDGAFPGQSRTPAWDLLQFDPRVWDRNARIDDRQLFLDALLTPSDRLIITAPTQNVRNNRKEPFSSCVDELLRALHDMGADRNSIVVQHRLQPFSRNYFISEGGLPKSFDSYLSQIAAEMESDDKKPGIPLWVAGDDKQGPAIEQISIRQLAAFWKDPAKAFLDAQCIALSQGSEEDDEELDRPPISLDALQSWKVKDAIVRQVAFGSGDLAHLEALFRANRMLPPAEIGTREWNSQREFGESLGSSIKNQLGERIPIEHLPEGIDVHVTGEVYKTRDETHLLGWNLSKMDKKVYRFLDPWITSLALSHSGCALPTMLFDRDNLITPVLLPAIPPSLAGEILRFLIQGYLEGQQRPLCYAPETSEDFFKRLERGEDPKEALRSAAVAKWFGSGPYASICEGSGEAACLAWRDLNPFEDAQSWERWARGISCPLRDWRNTI